MKEYRINSSKNKKTKALDIEVQGYLNVSNIMGIKKELSSAIKNSKKVNLKISEVDDADLSLVQYLVGLKQMCQESNIEIKIDLGINNETLELFKRAGFANTIN